MLVSDYLGNYCSYDNKTTKGSPFVFDSGGNYERFRDYFKEKYCSLINENYPLFFDFVFDYIKNMSDHFRLFEKFYVIRSKETFNEVLAESQKVANQAVSQGISDSVTKAINTITSSSEEAEKKAEEAKFQAKLAEEQAEKAKSEATNAAKSAVEVAVKSEMASVSTKVSENSVTILGIFSGIVLTVVAGLFYSSSVLDNINNANVWKLICIASVVGLVCYHLIALMFRFIEKIKDSSKKVDELNPIDKVVSWFFIGAIVLTGVLQLIFPAKTVKEPDKTNTSIYAEVDVDTHKDESKITSEEPTTSTPETVPEEENTDESSLKVSTNEK